MTWPFVVPGEGFDPTPSNITVTVVSTKLRVDLLHPKRIPKIYLTKKVA